MTPEQIKRILDENLPHNKPDFNHCPRCVYYRQVENIAKAAYALAESEKDKEIAELRKEAEEWKKQFAIATKTNTQLIKNQLNNIQ